jgi:soluble calcium-activated nucleotidase 1
MLHESVVWAPERNRWYFLPRRCSTERYNETLDEHKGCNYLISADELFADIKVVKIGELRPTRGFSSFKFIPGTDDSIILALKTEEVSGTTATYVTIFDINGKIYMDDIKIPTDYKYEGIEFI